MHRRAGNETEHEIADQRAAAGMAAHLYALADRFLQNDGEYERWFREQQASVWGSSLDLLAVANFTGWMINAKVGAEWTGPKRQPPRLRALRELHARSMVVVDEISTLLRAGYPSGAHARWRTLHEIEVTATVLDSSPQTISDRYLASSLIELAARYESDDSDLEFDADHIRRLKVAASRKIARHGPEMKRQYGWAAPLAGGKKVTFRDLEVKADLARQRHAYVRASKHVHDGRLANLETLRTGAPGVLNVGRRFDGAATPIWRTIWTAQGVTYLLAKELCRVLRDDIPMVWANAYLELCVEADRLVRREDSSFALRTQREPELPPSLRMRRSSLSYRTSGIRIPTPLVEPFPPSRVPRRRRRRHCDDDVRLLPIVDSTPAPSRTSRAISTLADRAFC